MSDKKTLYKAIAVDIIPGESVDSIHSRASYGYGHSVAEAEQNAIARSAVNCDRRVYVEETFAPFHIVKGPYLLKKAGL